MECCYSVPLTMLWTVVSKYEKFVTERNESVTKYCKPTIHKNILVKQLFKVVMQTLLHQRLLFHLWTFAKPLWRNCEGGKSSTLLKLQNFGRIGRVIFMAETFDVFFHFIFCLASYHLSYQSFHFFPACCKVIPLRPAKMSGEHWAAQKYFRTLNFGHP